jgi:predicted metal-dependent peptidase
MDYVDDSPAIPNARVFVKTFAPYLGHTLYALLPMPVADMVKLYNGPMAVTGQLVLLYDPTWALKEDPHVVATGLAHECFHVQLEHVRRGAKYPDPKTFFIACDLFINGVMVEQKRNVRVKGKGGAVETQPLWKFPDWALLPEQYGWPNGLTADEYYRLLKKQEQADKKKAGAQGTPTPGDGEPGSDGPGKSASKIMSGCCGGMSSQSISQALEAAANARKGKSESYLRNVILRTSNDIKEHLRAIGRGDKPGAWSELITIGEKQFDVPWQFLLADATSQTIDHVRVGGADYSLRRPSKRSPLYGYPVPGLIDYDPILWLVMDSSGSMGKQQLGDALHVCADVIDQTGISEVYYLDADAKVQREPMQISVHDLYQMEVLGRGGTDFRPAIEKADKAIPRPDIVIYLTDGDGTAPDCGPANMEFIWCVVPTSNTKPATWGQTIFLK